MSRQPETKEVTGGVVGGLISTITNIATFGLLEDAGKTYETTDGTVSGTGSTPEESNAAYEQALQEESDSSNDSDDDSGGSFFGW